MSLISDSKINQILESSNIVDIIGEYVDLKRAGSSFKGLCPFHNEKTPSFTVDEKKQLFHCFGCGAGGDVVSFIMQKEGLSYPESLKYLADKAGISIDYTENPGVNKKNKELYDINKDIMMFFYKNLLTDRKAQAYLKSRGLSSKIVNTFMLGYARDSWDDLYSYIRKKNYSEKDLDDLGLIKKSSKGNYYDKYRDRIIFPIINHFGKVIGFGGRAVSGQMPKYLNSPESSIFKKRYNLYGLNIYKRQKRKELILVEGYMDVIALNNHGLDIAVASLGTALTIDQAKLMKRYSDDIYICYDQDNAGVKATEKAIEIFHEIGINPSVIVLDDGNDPDDFIKAKGKDAFEEKIADAQDSYNYKYNKILDEYSSAKPAERFDKLNLFVDFLASIKQELTQEIFINNVSKLFDIDKTTLKQAVSRYNKDTDLKYSNKSKFNKKEKIIVESTNKDFRINELEVLRLFFNQRSDYEKDRDFFDRAIENEKINNVKTFLKEKDVSKFDLSDEDYKYILDYIRDNTNPILAEELKRKIILYNRKKELKRLKKR
ncbi:DNA primase [Anaerococcus prevotii]|uniref:DNA primase n=1 Tax=Anaerococcus prevotii (strain ATCC 9321 / DSM 20548 / JCM 6508 / NCTC 11806 / PC1) TaxID=525919 RepID=C7RD99_ANAPD|nr:DNA primase [Anaerococcus prevotii]ACV29162.1 DNA primase [Anaerococcus prevotii DSM 20548]SUU94836.1 DNA primase [Anaerococcus prevotii]